MKLIWSAWTLKIKTTGNKKDEGRTEPEISNQTEPYNNIQSVFRASLLPRLCLSLSFCICLFLYFICFSLISSISTPFNFFNTLLSINPPLFSSISGQKRFDKTQILAYSIKTKRISYFLDPPFLWFSFLGFFLLLLLLIGFSHLPSLYWLHLLCFKVILHLPTISFIKHQLSIFARIDSVGVLHLYLV